ncbi:AlkA N-terminal domain-containing protein [Barrientosiimonas endolithica]|uniref:DNA-3-methyladenine glycosylase II n=1 Tax=Barrientosiimonas endolithica TaxID=1535208 RepID=A0ABM8H712_9MICO|nr:AlkA N-terminal domain-containing protein [Barrientosiimonas endolithica]BDZ56650.1 DNA-3-methyladenine glycosylase [Barrientosiimonas endolithica]
MHSDREACAAAVRSRDARFDGWFFTGVRTTGIYCRPSCPAMTPKAGNMVFYPSAAAAQAEGFRACKRCRPDTTPGSPEWNVRADVVARAMRLIADGVVDRDGVAGLATRLGYSVRQVERQVRAELGAGPLALARAQRAQSARLLIETTDLPLADVAFAAGFGSIRAFNQTVQEVYAVAPRDLRRTRAVGRGQGPGAGEVGPEQAGPTHPQAWQLVPLRLAVRRPFLPDNVFGHLAATAVPGIEEWRDGAYVRSLRLPHGPAVVALAPEPDHVAARLWLSDLRDLGVAVSRCRWTLDLDADPQAVDEALGADRRLAPLVRRAPGRRVPRSGDAEEAALRIVLGQQVSAAAARTLAARLVVSHGTALPEPVGGVTHVFPAPPELADLDPAALAMPAARRRTFSGLVRALADGDVDVQPTADPVAAREGLAALPGVGPWTVESIAMRCLGDPDAFPATDLGVRRGAESVGLPGAPGALVAASAAWRPWRAYAVQHLWATSDHPINRLPEPGTTKESA